MRRLATLAAVTVGLALLAFPAASALRASNDDGFATCKPNGTCTACKNCSSCKNCSKNGGTCSVCRKK